MPETVGILTACEILQIISFFCFIFHLSRVTNTIKVEREKLICSVSDYSVIVKNIPSDTTKEELIAHFNSLYPLDEKDWLGRSPVGTWASVCLSVCLFVYLCVTLSVCLSVCLSICLSLCVSVCLSAPLCLCLYVCHFVSLSVCLFICVAACLFVSVYLTTCKSIKPYCLISISRISSTCICVYISTCNYR